MSNLVRDVERLFQNYQYGEAGRQVYDFFWNEFADWYVEIAKLQIREGDLMAYSTSRNLVNVLDTCLRLLHPFTPFVTEEIWGHLKNAACQLKKPVDPFHGTGWEEALIVAHWPEPTPENPWESQAIADFTSIMEVVRAIRNLRSEKNVDPKQKIVATLVGGDRTAVLQSQLITVAALARLDPKQTIILESLAEKPEDHIALVVGQIEVYLPLAELVDPDEQRARLEKDLAEATSQIKRLEALLAGQFAEKAPPDVVGKERQKLADYQEKAEKVTLQLELLS
jgi:valyl-tRNA synthetase